MAAKDSRSAWASSRGEVRRNRGATTPRPDEQEPDTMPARPVPGRTSGADNREVPDHPSRPRDDRFAGCTVRAAPESRHRSGSQPLAIDDAHHVIVARGVTGQPAAAPHHCPMAPRRALCHPHRRLAQLRASAPSRRSGTSHLPSRASSSAMRASWAACFASAALAQARNHRRGSGARTGDDARHRPAGLRAYTRSGRRPSATASPDVTVVACCPTPPTRPSSPTGSWSRS